VETVLVTAAVLVMGGGVTVISWGTSLGTGWEHWMGITFSKMVSEVAGMVPMLTGTVPMRMMFWFWDWVAYAGSTVLWTVLTRFWLISWLDDSISASL
jgi:hypothetical protein